MSIFQKEVLKPLKFVDNIELVNEKKEKFDSQRKKIKKLKLYLKFLDSLIAILGLTIITLATIEYEIFYNDTETKKHYESNSLCDFIRSMILIINLINIIFLIMRNFSEFNFTIQRNIIPIGTNYYSSPYFKQLIFEILMNLIICPPKIDYKFEVRQLDSKIIYSFDGICMILIYFRCYLLLRLIAHYSIWTSIVADECCESEGCKADALFAIKV